MGTLREWFPIFLSLGAIIGGYFTLKAKVDQVIKALADFLNDDYKGFKEEQGMRVRKLEIDSEGTARAQAEINAQLKEQYHDIKRDLYDIKQLVGNKRID